MSGNKTYMNVIPTCNNNNVEITTHGHYDRECVTSIIEVQKLCRLWSIKSRNNLTGTYWLEPSTEQ